MKESKSELKTLQFILDCKIQFVVPEYQRRYVWEKKDWEPFFRIVKTILDQKNKSQEHFLGTLNLIKRSENEYEVADGYQRLLTLSLFLLALRHCAPDDEKKEVRILNLKPNFYPKKQQEFYEDIEERILNSEDIENALKNKKIIGDTIFCFFSESLKWIKERKEMIISNIVSLLKEKILFSLVFWDNSMNGQKIFKAMNLIGRKLATSHQMKQESIVEPVEKYCKEGEIPKKAKIKDFLEEYWNNWDQEFIRSDLGKEAFNDFVKVLKKFNKLFGSNSQKKEWIFSSELSDQKEHHKLLELLTEYVSLYLLIASKITNQQIKESRVEKKGEIVQIMDKNILKTVTTLEGKSNVYLSNSRRALLFFLALCFEREVIDFAFFEKLVEIFTIYQILLDVGLGNQSLSFCKVVVEKIRTCLEEEKIGNDCIFFDSEEKKTISQKQEKIILEKVIEVLKKDIKNKNVQWYEDLKKSFKNDDLSETVEGWFWRNSNQRFKITSKNILHFATRREWEEEEINIEHINPQTKGKKKQRYIYHVGNTIYLERTLNAQASDETLLAKVEIYKQSKNKEVRELADSIEKDKIENWDEQHIRERGVEVIKKMFNSQVCNEFFNSFFKEEDVSDK